MLQQKFLITRINVFLEILKYQNKIKMTTIKKKNCYTKITYVTSNRKEKIGIELLLPYDLNWFRHLR